MLMRAKVKKKQKTAATVQWKKIEQMKKIQVSKLMSYYENERWMKSKLLFFHIYFHSVLLE